MPDFTACGTAQESFWGLTRTICPAGFFQKHGPLMWLWEWYALGWWLCPDLAGFGTFWVSSQKLWHRKTGQGEVHFFVEFFMLWVQWVDVSQESISGKKPPESSNFTRKIRFRKSSNLNDVNTTKMSRNTDDSDFSIALCASVPSSWLVSDYGKVILKCRNLDRAPSCRDNRTGGIKTTVWNCRDETQPTGLCWKVAHRYITITLLWDWKCWVIVFPCQCAQGALQQ